MSDNELVAGLIIRDPIQINKSKMYKSKYPPNIFPTASTFCIKTTSIPGVGNLNGHYSLRKKSHINTGGFATFGRPKNSIIEKENKKNKTSDNFVDFETKYTKALKLIPKKNIVPKHNHLPLTKLNPTKNFVKENWLKNKKIKPKSIHIIQRFIDKRNYGKVPAYLNKIKENIEKDYNEIREIKQKEENEKKKEKYFLTKDEISNLKKGLKNKWDELNCEYLKIAHIKNPDTKVKQEMKVNLEKEMHKIEEDIKKISKYVLVVNSN